MKYIYSIIFSLILFALIFYISMFFVWGRILDTNNVLTFAILIAITFFIFNVYREANRDKKSKNRNIGSFFKYFGSTILISFIYVFSVSTWHEMTYDVEKTYKLYKYKNYPCQDVVFKTVNKMNLVAHNRSFMAEGAYFVTRNTLEENHDYLENRGKTEYIDKGKYPIGSEWKIIGFYNPRGSTGGILNYFLAQSVKDNNIAWIASMDFDYQQCQPNFYSYETRAHDYPMYEPGSNSTKELVDFTNLKMKPYE